jgi:hypothetical protein
LQTAVLDRKFTGSLDNPEDEKTVLETYDIDMRDIHLPITVEPLTNAADHERMGIFLKLGNETAVVTTEPLAG